MSGNRNNESIVVNLGLAAHDNGEKITKWLPAQTPVRDVVQAMAQDPPQGTAPEVLSAIARETRGTYHMVLGDENGGTLVSGKDKKTVIGEYATESQVRTAGGFSTVREIDVVISSYLKVGGGEL